MTQLPVNTHPTQTAPSPNFGVGRSSRVSEPGPVTSQLNFPAMGIKTELQSTSMGRVQAGAELSRLHPTDDIIPAQNRGHGEAWACRTRTGPAQQESVQKSNEMAREDGLLAKGRCQENRGESCTLEQFPTALLIVKH